MMPKFSRSHSFNAKWISVYLMIKEMDEIGIDFRKGVVMIADKGHSGITELCPYCCHI